MAGGRSLFFSLLLFMSSFVLIAAAVFAGDTQSSTVKVPDAPPAAPIKPILELIHGTKVVDNYRWLEDGNSPATQKWVAEGMSYNGAILAPLPGRKSIHKRRTELPSIGRITAPFLAANIIFIRS